MDQKKEKNMKLIMKHIFAFKVSRLRRVSLFSLYVEEHRNYYYATRAKAVRNKKKDISMIVDASGGTGTIHQPHMSVQSKNEPERHTLLHTKCTFTKVTILYYA